MSRHAQTCAVKPKTSTDKTRSWACMDVSCLDTIIQAQVSPGKPRKVQTSQGKPRQAQKSKTSPDKKRQALYLFIIEFKDMKYTSNTHG